MSKRNKDGMGELKERLAALEEQMAGITQAWQGLADLKPGATLVVGESWATAQPETPEATQLLRDFLPALSQMAQTANQPLLFVATADGQQSAGGSPIPFASLAVEENVRPLADLGAALGNLSRVKMLQALLTQEECSTVALAEASGASGGNLYQHLSELHTANLVFQPSRGRYRLTPTGGWIVAMLFYCGFQVRFGHNTPTEHKG